MAIIPQSFRSDPTRVFSAEARELGLRLAALVDAHISDLPKLEALVAKAGFSQDSTGQWFHGAKGEVGGMHVPTPAVLQPNFLKNAPTLL